MSNTASSRRSSRANGYVQREHGARAGRFRAARRHRRSVAAGQRTAAAARFLRRGTRRRSAPSMPRRNCPATRSTRSSSCRRAKRRSIRRRSAGSAAAMSRASGRRRDDPLYEVGQRRAQAQGMEHWLPLFHDHLDTLFDFVPDALILLGASERGGEGRAAGADRRLLRDAQGHAPRQGRRRQARDQGAPLQAAAAGCALSDRRGMDRRAASAIACAISRRSRRRNRRSPSMPAASAARDFAPERTQRTSTCSKPRPQHIKTLQTAEQARGRRVVERRLGGAHGRRAVRSRARCDPQRSPTGPMRASCTRAPSASRCWVSSTVSRRRTWRSSPSRTSSATAWCASTRAAPRAEFPPGSVEPRAGRSRHAYRARRRTLSRPQDHRRRRRAARLPRAAI